MILALVYGYIPYMILPLFGQLDRINQSLLEAGRDLGASPARTFWRVTLPLSKQAILAGVVIVSLPMFGDYYTNNLHRRSPTTSMVGNLIDNSVGQDRTGAAGRLAGADPDDHVDHPDVLLPAFHPQGAGVRMSDQALTLPAEKTAAAPKPSRFRDPWRKPRFLEAITWGYIAWSLLPVIIAVLFSFNDGRSRSTWQGFSLRGGGGTRSDSLFHDPALHERHRAELQAVLRAR